MRDPRGVVAQRLRTTALRAGEAHVAISTVEVDRRQLFPPELCRWGQLVKSGEPMSPALAILPSSARLTGFQPGSPGPKLLTRRGRAPCFLFEVFCDRWEFYDMTQVAPAIIDV